MNMEMAGTTVTGKNRKKNEGFGEKPFPVPL
jgi:hypothetical protein